MKKLTLTALLLLSSQIHAQESKNFIYGGLDLGMSSQKSDDWNNEDTANGKHWGAKLIYQYKMPEVSLELGLGWVDYKISNDIKTGPYSHVSMKTKAPYLHGGAYYRFTKQFSLGASVDYVLDDGILVSATDKSKVLAGLGAYYSLSPEKQNDVRFGVNLKRSMDFADREATLLGISVQIGFGLDKTPQKQVVKVQRKVEKQGFTHTKKDVTLVTLDETLINFETDSYTLDSRSKALLADLGAFLVSNQDIWEYAEIKGHTDLRGSDYYNNVLSVRRANSCYQELTTLSLDSKKLFFEGEGKSNPIDTTVSTEAFAKNRRVELRFINVSDKVKFNHFINKLKQKYQK